GQTRERVDQGLHRLCIGRRHDQCLFFVVAESKRGRTVKQPAPVDDESELVEDLSETVSTAGLADTTQFDELAKAFPGSQIIDDKK
ncbi:MAG: hypothetical protein ACKPAJ_11495, partial [Actinomycetota bacterium]